MNDDSNHPWINPYARAYQAGRESGERDGDWRDNPHLPGSREYYEFHDGQRDAKKDRRD